MSSDMRSVPDPKISASSFSIPRSPSSSKLQPWPAVLAEMAERVIVNTQVYNE